MYYGRGIKHTHAINYWVAMFKVPLDYILKSLLKYCANPKSLITGLKTSFNHLLEDLTAFERYRGLIDVQISFQLYKKSFKEYKVYTIVLAKWCFN